MIDMTTAPFAHLLINFLLSIGVGLTIGIERTVNNREDWKMAGLRDFILVAALSFVASLYYEEAPFAWMGSFVTVILFTVAVFVIRNLQVEERTIGMTTLLALPFTFMVAGLPNFGAPYWTIATIVFVVLLVLGMKVRFYQFVSTIDKAEVIDFAILIGIAISITPLIPGEAKLPIPLIDFADGMAEVTYRYVSFSSLWNVVVMVSLMSFTAHFVTKYVRGKNALLIASFLGGLVSSLATMTMLLRSNADRDAGAELNRRQIFLAFAAASTGAIARAILILRVTVGGEMFSPFSFPLISILVLFMSITGYVFAAQANTEQTLRLAPRALPLSFILRFSLTLAGLIIAMTMIKFYLGPEALIPASFLSGIASSGAAVSSIGAAMMQRGGVDPWIAGLAIIGTIIGSLYAKYMVISRHIGFNRSALFLLPLFGLAAVGLITLWISLNSPV
ncbi:MAG: DUF4010 domain-containing protein [Rhodospirillales bacterium]|nr:DUF4010 domain-containing protein [Alphaproteobacteria bacterium]MCB9987447.1 DUF4010 domain-containing protein [Rhodospirillales bacterium]USO07574.1 MAG: DUF4010 domain-containing protein [Rhodospirillales bacterium]